MSQNYGEKKICVLIFCLNQNNCKNTVFSKSFIYFMNICDFSSAAVSSAWVLLSYSGPGTSPEPFYAPNTNCPEYFYFTNLLNQLISKAFLLLLRFEQICATVGKKVGWGEGGGFFFLGGGWICLKNLPEESECECSVRRIRPLENV